MSKNNKIALVACSGAANTGQIANEAVASLCKKSDDYTMVCLAALTLNRKNSLDKIAGVGKIIIVDDYPVKCASQVVSKFTDKKLYPGYSNHGAVWDRKNSGIINI